MSKHTPGPWKLEILREGYRFDPKDPLELRNNRGTGEPVLISVLASDGFSVATVNWRPPPGFKEETFANTHLIAAAPDLLEVAEDFVAKVDRGDARSTDSYAKFKAAIAKATP